MLGLLKMLRRLGLLTCTSLFGVWLLPYDFKWKIRFLKWLAKSPRK